MADGYRQFGGLCVLSLQSCSREVRRGGVLYNVYVYVCSAEREAQVLNPEGGWELQT